MIGLSTIFCLTIIPLNLMINFTSHPKIGGRLCGTVHRELKNIYDIKLDNLEIKLTWRTEVVVINPH